VEAHTLRAPVMVKFEVSVFGLLFSRKREFVLPWCTQLCARDHGKGWRQIQSGPSRRGPGPRIHRLISCVLKSKKHPVWRLGKLEKPLRRTKFERPSGLANAQLRRWVSKKQLVFPLFEGPQIPTGGYLSAAPPNFGIARGWARGKLLVPMAALAFTYSGQLRTSYLDVGRVGGEPNLSSRGSH